MMATVRSHGLHVRIEAAMRFLVDASWRHTLAVLMLLVGLWNAAAASDKVDFVRNVQPILRGHCYSCHGEKKQLSGLRLDVKTAALKGGESHGVAIVPGRSGESVLVQLVRGDDKDLRM